MPFDPISIGMIAGGVAGAGGGVLESREKRKAEEATRPKHRRMTKLQEMMNESFNRRQRALLAVAQSHLDYAKMF